MSRSVSPAAGQRYGSSNGTITGGLAVNADINRLYEEDIRPLPASSRLELLARIAGDLASVEAEDSSARRSILELEGLGAAMWEGVDAQAYVDQLRREWETRG